MIKKILSLLLLLSLLTATLMTTSCVFVPLIGDNIDRGDESENDGVPPNIYVTGGDTNNITINSSESSTVHAAAKGLLSSVSLVATFEERVLFAGMLVRTDEFTQSGSGVIYKLDKERGEAYVITNYHVVFNDESSTVSTISKDITLRLFGMESEKYEIPAKFIGGSIQYDLAVLKVSASPILMASAATAVTVADSNLVAVLDQVIAIGNPDAEGISATVGHVNVDSEQIKVKISDNTAPVPLRVMRIDNAINPGNSGGGLFNQRGELIGIVNAKDMDEDNMSYAISSNSAKYVADNIIYHYNGKNASSVMEADLGLTLEAKELYVSYDEKTGCVYKCERVAVSGVSMRSAAKGLLQVGDVINHITVDGVKYDVTRIFHAEECLLNARAGSTVKYNVTRGGEVTEVVITVTQEMLVKKQ